MIRLAVLTLALAAGAACSSRGSEPPARRSIVVITVDTLRADHVNARVAPGLDRLARDAVSFDAAVTVAPVTLPAHASLLTSRYPPAHGVRDNQIFSLGEAIPTHTQWLKERGYRTAAFVSAIVLDRRYGLARGFDHYDDDLKGAAERNARETLTRAEQWLSGAAGGAGRAPVFLWIHLFEPHAPYAAGSYAAEVTAVDSALAEFFAALRRLGAWDDLVLSVTADHGEALGDHGESTHGYFVYDSTIRIPWILKAPGLGPRRFAHQVRIVDVLPTMIAAAHASPDAKPAAADGVDLLPFVARNESPRLEAYVESWLPRHQFNWSELKGIRTERLKYIDAPEPELYDLTHDPSEARNLAPAQRDTVSSLSGTLRAVLTHAAAPSPQAAGDPVIAERFMSLGYIGFTPGDTTAEGKWLPDPKAKLPVYELTMQAFELMGRGQAAQALAALARAERLDARVTQVHYLKGTILGNQDKYAEAAAALERAVELNPRYVPARFKLALAYLRLGRPDRAERGLQAVLEREPKNVRAIHNLAAIAYSRGDLDRAEQLEKQAVAIDARYFEAWNTLGAIYVVRKRPAEAIEALNTATGLDPSSGQARYNLALALRADGQAEAARQAEERACALDRQFCR